MPNQKPRVKVNTKGNLYNILAISQSALKENEQEDKIEEMWQRVRDAKDFNRGLEIIQEYVEFS